MATEMETSDLTKEVAALYRVPPNELVRTIKAQCFPNGAASDSQLMMFLTVCRERRLNPFLKEVYAFMQDGKMQIGVEVDGWIRKAQEHSQYDGCEFIDKYGDDKKIFSVTCRIHRKDWKRPGEYTALLSEWNKPSNAVWTQKPRHMLAIKAFNQAVRWTLGLTGFGDADDIRATVERVNTDTGEVLNPETPPPDAIETTATKVEDKPSGGSSQPDQAAGAGAEATPPLADATGTGGTSAKEPEKKKRGRPRNVTLVRDPLPSAAAESAPAATTNGTAAPATAADLQGFVAAHNVPQARVNMALTKAGVERMDQLDAEQSAAILAQFTKSYA